MTIRRIFLDWKQPALPAAVQVLLSTYRQENRWDLQPVTIVVPGRRAGHRLLELLVQVAEENSLLLSPPTITTEGRLPELLYQPKRQFASELTQQLAWAEALKKLARPRLLKLVPFPPASNDTSRWLELGDMLRTLHTELAADGLDFSHVAAKGKDLTGFTDSARWEVLSQIQTAYLQQLDALQLWDLQTARLVAIQQKELVASGPVVLLGAVDLNRALRQMLDQIAAQVTVLVHAPENLAERFDPYGCLIAEAWQEAPLALDDSQIRRVDGPVDQAVAVAQWLEDLQGRYRADEIIVGVPDELLVSQISRELKQRGLTTHWVEGRKLAETAPYRLISSLANYAQRKRFTDFAMLLRQIDLEAWLAPKVVQQLMATLGEEFTDKDRREFSLARQADDFYADQFAAVIDSERIAHLKADWPAMDCVVKLLDEVLKPLMVAKQSLAAWGSTLRQMLVTFYGDQIYDRNIPAQRAIVDALKKIDEGLQAAATIPAEMESPVDLSVALSALLTPLAGEATSPLQAENAIEMLGWLELPLHDAPALLVTSFNEGFVPKSVQGDKFLPNQLRVKLGLLHNDRRYARDAYAISVLAASRSDLRLLVARRDADSAPLAPSRLLFATDELTLAKRAKLFFSSLPPAVSRRPPLAGAGQIPETSSFAVPLPQSLREPLEKISVSQFKAYLACPYRFYLSQMLNLRSADDSPSELDPGAFGDLVHNVLQHFGHRDNPSRHSTKGETIFEFLDHQLQTQMAKRFGKETSRAAIRVQVAQIQARLRQFSQWQAERVRSGWQIAYSEDFEQRLSVPFDVDGQPIKLMGRIDRIDYNPMSKQYCILDYKTSDRARSPAAQHRTRAGEWTDLQLPLYRHLAQDVKLDSGEQISGEPQLGYIHLPKDLSAVDVSVVDWDASILADADACARNVVRNIRAQKFWPMASPPPAFSEDLAPICQDNLLGVWHEIMEEEAAE